MVKRMRTLAAMLAPLLVGLVLFATSANPQSAHAAGVRYAAPAIQGSGDCSSWANACTLHTALSNALSGDEIWVMQGVHYPDTTGLSFPRKATFTLKNGVAVYGGFAGTETSRAQRDWQTNVTILSGDIGVSGDASDNSFHVVVGSGADNTAVLDGFTISGGNADDSSLPNNAGGGMYNDSGSPTLVNVTFSGNSATNGGGMGNYNGSNPALTNVIFSGNTATNGGGMYNYNGSSPTLTSVTFDGNTAYSGGGMYNSTSSSPTLTNATFSGNSATNGGGMGNHNASNPTLTNVTFSGNSATNGGGMYNFDTSNATLTNVTFSNNSATNNGGGIYNSITSSPTLTNVTVEGNTAKYGGGMYNNNNSSPTLTNVAFRDNSAVDGGGLFNTSSAPALANVTFNGNSATNRGGGMINGSYSNPTLVNTILWGDSALNGSEIYNDIATANISYSDIQGCGGSGGWSSACGTDGGNNIDVDPLFVDAAGGNLQLRIGSPATDTGNNSAVPPGVTTDLGGNPRIADGDGDSSAVVDMGAYEKPANSAPSFTSTPVTAATQDALYTYAVTATDPDLVYGDVLIIAGTTLPAWLTLTDNGDGTATLSGTPANGDVGQHPVALQVTDLDDLTATQTFTITVSNVNDPPSFTSAPVTAATQDALYTYAVTATDPDLAYGDVLAITAPTLPAWLTLTDKGDGTATLSGTPVNADVGQHSVSLRVTDLAGLTATQTFTITVSNVNDPPSFTSTPVTISIQAVPYTYTVATTDPDLAYGDVLAITAPTLPAWLTLTDKGDGTATLSGTPAAADVGQHSVVLQVADGGGLTAAQTFTITVNVNSAPSFTSTPVTGATQDAPYTYAVTAADPDLVYGDVLAISAPTGPAWLTLTDNGDGTATLSGTPANADVGQHSISLQVIDLAGLTATQAFTITVSNVNDPPSFTSTPVTSALEDAPYTYNVTASDPDLAYGDGITITAPTLPAWLTFTQTGNGTATLSGTPTTADIGQHSVSLRVTDSNGLAATQAFTIIVAYINDPPFFTSTPVTAATQDALYTYAITADDPDLPYGDALTISAPTGPAWLTVTDNGDGTATLSGTPANADVGQHSVSLRVTDRSGVTATQTFTVTVSNVNDPPSFTSTPVTSALEDAPYTYAVTATDPDLPYGDVLAITAPTLPAWLTLTDKGDGTATLSGTPTIADVGQHSVSLRVTDGNGLAATQAFTINVAYINDPPSFTSTPVTAATQDALYTYAITAGDPDLVYGDVLTIAAPTLPAWLTLTDNGDGTATLSGTPANGDVGQHPVVLRVADSGDLTATQTFTITVSNVNDPPSFTSTPVTGATQDAPYTYAVTAADPDLAYGDVLAITAPTLPAWLTLTDKGDGTATLSGTPANGDVGQHPVVLQVTDSGGLIAVQTFTITVSNVNNAPSFTSTPVTAATQDALYTYAVTAADPDLAYGDALAITAPTLPAWLTLTDNGDGTATLSGTPANADVGQHPVMLRVADRAGAFATQEFVLTVREKSDYTIYLPSVLTAAAESGSHIYYLPVVLTAATEPGAHTYYLPVVRRNAP